MYLSVACTSNNYTYIYNATWLVSNLRSVGSHLKSHISGWNRVWWWSQLIHFLVDSPKSPIFLLRNPMIIWFHHTGLYICIKIYIYIHRLIPLFCCFNQRKSKFASARLRTCQMWNRAKHSGRRTQGRAWRWLGELSSLIGFWNRGGC